MNLRRAQPEDEAALTDLEAAVFGPDAWSATAVRAELTGQHRYAVVAAAGGRVVGYVMSAGSGGIVDLLRIAVVPTHRRRGLARQLLGAVLHRARVQQAEAVLLEVSERNPEALAFYAAAGFERIGRRKRYYRDGSDALVLRRDLARDPGGDRDREPSGRPLGEPGSTPAGSSVGGGERMEW